MGRAFAFDQVFFLVEGFAGYAVVAGVLGLVNVPLGFNPAEYLFDGPGVPVFCGADEVVVLYSESRPCLPEDSGHLVAVIARVLALSDCGLAHVLGVLVVSHGETRVPASEFLVLNYYVRADLLVGCSEVWKAVHIIYGRGQVELTRHLTRLPRSRAHRQPERCRSLARPHRFVGPGSWLRPAGGSAGVGRPLVWAAFRNCSSVRRISSPFSSSAITACANISILVTVTSP